MSQVFRNNGRQKQERSKVTYFMENLLGYKLAGTLDEKLLSGIIGDSYSHRERNTVNSLNQSQLRLRTTFD